MAIACQKLLNDGKCCCNCMSHLPVYASQKQIDIVNWVCLSNCGIPVQVEKHGICEFHESKKPRFWFLEGAKFKRSRRKNELLTGLIKDELPNAGDFWVEKGILCFRWMGGLFATSCIGQAGGFVTGEAKTDLPGRPFKKTPASEAIRGILNYSSGENAIELFHIMAEEAMENET